MKPSIRSAKRWAFEALLIATVLQFIAVAAQTALSWYEWDVIFITSPQVSLGIFSFRGGIGFELTRPGYSEQFFYRASGRGPQDYAEAASRFSGGFKFAGAYLKRERLPKFRQTTWSLALPTPLLIVSSAVIVVASFYPRLRKRRRDRSGRFEVIPDDSASQDLSGP